MNKQTPYHNWLNNPERRVGRLQLLRAIAAAAGTNDPAYRADKEQLETRRAGGRRKSRAY